MIQIVDHALADLLEAEMGRIGETPPQITFDPPCDETDTTRDRAGINASDDHIHLYLYDVRECLEQRDMTLRRVHRDGAKQGSAEFKRAPVYFDLSYLLSVRAGDQEREHGILSRALGALLRSPKLTWQNGDETTSAPLEVSCPGDVAGTSLETLWLSLSCRIRPAVKVVVTAPFDPFDARPIPLVRDVNVTADAMTGRNRISAVGYTFDGSDAEREPLAGVIIRVADGTRVAQSDARGFFYVQNLPAGERPLTFEKNGYYPRTLPIAVTLSERAVALEQAQDMEVVLMREQAPTVVNALTETEREFADGALSGRLLWHNRPAAHIYVRIGGHCTLTDAKGFYTFYDLSEISGPLLAMVPGVGERSVPDNIPTSAPSAVKNRRSGMREK